MKDEPTVYLLTAGGLVLIVLSFLLPRLVGGERAWTDADATSYSQAAADLHEAIHAQAHDHGPSDGHGGQSLEVAKKRFAEHKAKLEAARNRGSLTGMVLLGLGLTCSGAGIVMFFIQRTEQAA